MCVFWRRGLEGGCGAVRRRQAGRFFVWRSEKVGRKRATRLTEAEGETDGEPSTAVAATVRGGLAAGPPGAGDG